MTQMLERSLSLTGAVGLIVGFVVGGSIFVLTPELAGMTGPSLWLAYGFSAIPAIFASLYLIQLGGALPVTGSNYIAVTRWVSPSAGFSSSMATGIAMVSGNCLMAWGFAEYLAPYLPGIPITLNAVGVIVLFGIVNWFGSKFFEKIQIAMMAIFAIAMLIFGVGGILNVDPAIQTPFFAKGTESFITVIAIATFSWAGVISIVEVAGEVKNPRVNIPLSILISMMIISILYGVQTYALTGTLYWKEAAQIGSTAVLVAASTFLPGWCVQVISVGALMAMATSINAVMMMGAREVLVWSRDQVIPRPFGAIHPRHKTPGRAIILITALSILGVLFAADIQKYALMVIFALMVIQFLGATAVLRMPHKAPEIYEQGLFQFSAFWRWFIWVGCAVFFLLIFLFGFLADYQTGVVFLGLLGITILYWFFRKQFLLKRGICLESKLSELGDSGMLELGSVKEQ